MDIGINDKTHEKIADAVASGADRFAMFATRTPESLMAYTKSSAITLRRTDGDQ